MRLNFIGGTGLRVSELSLGFGAAAGWEAWDEKVGMALDHGICLFDTSDSYGNGESETRLAPLLKGRRDKILLSTKGAYRVGDGPNDLGTSRHHIINACDASLRRLGTDWIDLYQLHAPDVFTRPEETMRVMDDLVRSGKVRYVGCSNYAAWQVMRAQAAAQSMQVRPFTFQQIYYSLVCRDAEFDLFPMAEDQNIGSLVWGPLAAGFLSGKYQREQPRPDGARLAMLPELGSVPDWESGFRILDVVREIAEKREVSIGQVSINWLMRKPWVASTIVGARTAAQLKDNLGAVDWRLTPEETAQLDEVSSRASLPYPAWILRMGAPERNPPMTGYRE